MALNKHGRRYKASALRDIEGGLHLYVLPAFGAMRLCDVRRGDCQALVDQLTPRLSGSRVRSVVNAIRTIYRWAHERDLVETDPAARVRLPAMNAVPRSRVATPGEMVALLSALDPEDAIPYALAVYTTARRAEIRTLRWRDLDFDRMSIHLGEDEAGRKSEAARRVVPMVEPLKALLEPLWKSLGVSDGAGLVCAGRRRGGRNGGALSFEALQVRADRAWADADLARITAHECRHTCITWLDAAGVRPKVVSAIAGHSSPATLGAPRITQERYTHVLPGDVEAARDLLNAYLARSATQNAVSPGLSGPQDGPPEG